VTELRGPHAVARPVVARMVHGVGVRAAVRLGAGQDVVLVRRVADAVHDALLFVQRELLAECVAKSGLLDRVAVELGDALRDSLPSGVVPRSIPDAVARIHGIRALGAQIGVPHCAAASGRRRQRLAMSIRAGETANVRPISFSDTGDEERHGLWWTLLSARLTRRRRRLSSRGGGLLCDGCDHQVQGSEPGERERRQHGSDFLHLDSLFPFYWTTSTALGGLTWPS